MLLLSAECMAEGKEKGELRIYDRHLTFLAAQSTTVYRYADITKVERHGLVNNKVTVRLANGKAASFKKV